MSNKPSNTKFHSQIVNLLQSAREKVVRVVNHTMVATYFEIGKKVVEEEQGGKDRAEYGKYLINELSKVLTANLVKASQNAILNRCGNFIFHIQKRRHLLRNLI